MTIEPTSYTDRPTQFASDLTHYRLHARLTQTELANTLGVTPASVSNWETGRYVPRPTHMRTLQGLIGHLDVPVVRKDTAATVTLPPEDDFLPPPISDHTARRLELATTLIKYLRQMLSLTSYTTHIDTRTADLLADTVILLRQWDDDDA